MGQTHLDFTARKRAYRLLSAVAAPSFLVTLLFSSHIHAQEVPVQALEPETKSSRALKDSALSRTKGRGEFRHPLLFAPEDNGLGFVSPQIKWDLGIGLTANLGGLKFEASSIAVHLTQTKRAETPSRYLNASEGPELATHLSFNWPDVFAKNNLPGTVSIVNADDRVLWAQAINPNDRNEGREKADPAGFAALSLHAKAKWVLFDLPQKTFSFLGKGGSFRVCFAQQGEVDEKLRVCSAPFKIQSQADAFALSSATEEAAKATVLFDGKPLGPRGIVNFPAGRMISLKVVFADNSFVELSSRPVDLQLLDVVESRDGREIVLTGQGTKPLGRVRSLSQPETSFWAHTGVKRENVWQIALPRREPTVRVLGAFSLPFTLLFEFDRLPRESDRVYVRDAPSNGTYSSTPILHGAMPAGATVSSNESSAKKIDKQKFEWVFSAPVSGENNRARLIVQDKEGKNSWVAHHRLFRSYPYELSGRLTGITTQTQALVGLGEIAGAAWFESLGFTQNEIFSRQRWGLSARYFRALSAIDVSPTLQIDNFTVANMDLKYTFLRGLWNRDELMGLMLSYQYVNLTALSADLWGVGTYWARTMPKVFDDIFNIVPFMRHKKYVDMEFIAYPLTTTSQLSAGFSYNLNFRGKVFWSERFFGEAGFGIKNFVFDNQKANKSVQFMTTYGTCGLGVAF